MVTLQLHYCILLKQNNDDVVRTATYNIKDKFGNRLVQNYVYCANREKDVLSLSCEYRVKLIMKNRKLSSFAKACVVTLFFWSEMSLFLWLIKKNQGEKVIEDLNGKRCVLITYYVCTHP